MTRIRTKQESPSLFCLFLTRCFIETTFNLYKLWEQQTAAFLKLCNQDEPKLVHQCC